MIVFGRAVHGAQKTENGGSVDVKKVVCFRGILAKVVLTLQFVFAVADVSQNDRKKLKEE